jgi:hypothetical protein
VQTTDNRSRPPEVSISPIWLYWREIRHRRVQVVLRSARPGRTPGAPPLEPGRPASRLRALRSSQWPRSWRWSSRYGIGSTASAWRSRPPRGAALRSRRRIHWVACSGAATGCSSVWVRGGMATVYRARDERPTREVAVKVLAERLAPDPLSVQRFRREAKLCARLAHPNIVAILDAGVEPRTSSSWSSSTDSTPAHCCRGRAA